jgi:hypothetical protein
LVQNFYNQLSTTQNARLELQLKALEADVQKQRYLADMKRADLCANVVGDMSKPPSEAAAKRAWEKLTSACIGLIEDKSLPVLGNLESLSGSDATLGSVAEEIFSRP